MDRIMRLRSPTDYRQDYKKRGISIDKRVLRAHNRAVDQRANRDKSYMCRRGEMRSPPSALSQKQIARPNPRSSSTSNIIEPVPVQLKENKTGGEQIKTADDIYREKLKKWKEEKLLKNKLKRNGKENKLFKVCKVTYDSAVYLATKKKPSGVQTQNRRPTTRATTRINNKKIEVERQQVRQQPKHPKSQTNISAAKGARQSARIAAKKVKVSTVPGTVDSSFAPSNFLFSAPYNVAPMQFVPMSPCSVQSFFCPDSKFNSTELSSRRCSTPLSARHRKPQALDLSVIPSNRRPIDVTFAPSFDTSSAPVVKKLMDNFPTKSWRKSQSESLVKEDPTEGVCTPVQGSKTVVITSNKSEVDASLSRETLLMTTQDGKSLPKTCEVEDIWMVEAEPATKDPQLTQEDKTLPTTGEVKDIQMDETEPSTKEPQLTQEDKTLPTTREVKDIQMNEVKPELSVPYFRTLVKSNTDKLNGICDKWEAELEMNNILGDDIMGDIRTSIGKAKLLIRQRFKQFNGLVDNCEFGTGLKETTCTDLQGFWEMVYIQVEDIEEMFTQLDNLKKNNWIKAEAKSQPKVKKTLKKKKVVKNQTGAAEAAKQRLAAIKAGMKMKQKQKEEEKVFDAGFFKVASPMKVNRQPHCQAGTPLRMVMRRNIASPAHVNESSVQPQVNQSSPMNRTALPYAFRTPRKCDKTPTTTIVPSASPIELAASPYAFRTPRRNGKTPTATIRTPVLRSSARKQTEQSLQINKDTTGSCIKPTDKKTPIKHQELNNLFSAFLQPTVVDLNVQAEELMVTEPIQQLNDIFKTPIHGNETPGKSINIFSEMDGAEPATKEPQEDKTLPTTGEVKDIQMNEVKPELSVPYFRSLVKSNTDKLNRICDKWEAELEMNNVLGDEIMGDIRTSIGKAKLLIRQRFKQFNGLVDNCEFGTGLKETTCTDLQGFWEMIYIQVGDIEEMFIQLDNLKKNNWIKAEAKSQTKVKRILKKKKVGVVRNKTAAAEAAKQRLAAIKAGMKMKQKQKEEEKVFDAGFFKVASPMKVNRQPHCQAGTPLRIVMRRNIASPAHVTEGSVQPQVNQSSPMNRTASPYAFRTPRKCDKTPTTTMVPSASPIELAASPYAFRTPRRNGKTPTATSRTPVLRSSARKQTEQSTQIKKNTTGSCINPTDKKTPTKHQELNNSFSAFLQPTVVDLNDQAEELMVTAPIQQLNDLVKTPIYGNGTPGKSTNIFSAKKSSSKKNIKKLDFIKNFESPKMESSNQSPANCVPATNDLICFNSPTPCNDGNEEYGLVERLAAISLPNSNVVFSPVRRSARFQHQESDSLNSQSMSVDKILFSPTKEL